MLTASSMPPFSSFATEVEHTTTPTVVIGDSRELIDDSR